MALLLAACAGEPPAPAGGSEDTRLVVTEYEGERRVGRTTLECADDPDGRCARVVALLPRLGPDPDEACAQVWGGPGRLVVEGRVRGDPVRLEVTRADACQIHRFDLLKEALGA